MKKREKKLREKARKLLLQKIEKKLKGSGFRNIEIHFLSPEEMEEINRRFLSRRGPATVITFPYGKGEEVEGEVFLCIEEILSQAEKSSADVEEYLEKISQHVLESLKK